MLKSLSLVLLVMMAVPCFAQEKGPPLFSDSFTTTATFAENWVPNEKGTKPQPEVGRVVFPGSGTLSTRMAAPRDFCVEAEITVEQGEKEGNSFCGFRIDGHVNCLVLPTGRTWFFYAVKGEKRSQGGRRIMIDGFEHGKPVRLTVIRRVDSGTATYSFQANGKDAGSYTMSAPEPISPDKPDSYKPVELFAYKVHMNLLNFSLFALRRSADDSRNLVINSSFEYDQEGFPLYYVRQSQYNYVQSKAPYEDYLAGWSLDTAEKYSGRQSLKMVLNDTMNGQGLAAWGAGTVQDMSGVFSVWMKADRENLPVTIRYGISKQVEVGTEWKRYEMVNPKLPKPFVYSPVSITFNKVPGTLWVDDLQAEFIATPDEAKLKAKDTFATPYKPSNLDKQKFGEQEEPARAPVITVKMLPSGVKPNGDLDAWKDKAAKLDKFYFKQNEATSKTETYLACDTRNLYIGYRCFVKDLAAVDTKPATHDSFGIFSRDSVEFFLNPSGTGATFYHCAADAGGSRTDIGPGSDVSWNGEWQSRAALNSRTNSIDYEITVPLATVADAAMNPRWLVNFCRNDAKEQVSMTRNGSFKQTAWWAYMELPAEVVTRYSLGATAGGYTDNDQGTVIALTLRNLSGKDVPASVELFDAQAKAGKLGEEPLTLHRGDNDVAFASAARTSKVRLKLSQNGEPLADQIVSLEKRTPIFLLSRLNYYMNEPEAILKVSTGLAAETAVLTAAGKTVKVPASAEFKITLPLKDIAPGTYPVSLLLFKGSQKVAENSTTLIKRPYHEGASQINQFTRSLIHDGKPIFQFAPLFCTQKSMTKEYVDSALDFSARHGFKYLDLLVGSHDLKQGVWALEKAKALGMRVMLWTKYDELSDEDADVMRKKLDFPNVVAQRVMDEPELSWPSDKALAILRKMKPLYPYQPVQMNNTVLGIPGRYANLETDILMLDDYLTNAENRTVASIVSATDIMRQAGREEGKPCFYFLVSQANHHYREPTCGEQIAQVYGNIAAGCTGFTFYDSWPKASGNWKALIQLNREILSLNDVLLSEEEIVPAICSADAKLLRNTTRLHDGYAYVIACNLDAKGMDGVTFTLPSGHEYAGEAEVMFEDRKIPVQDGKFTDTFPGHARHVYKVRIK